MAAFAALPGDAVLLPPLERTALLLDLDGTLLDIAPTPGDVVVPPDLVQTLGRLRGALGDALAIITGRPIEQVDALLPGLPYAVAGEHGGVIRHVPDAPAERVVLPDPPACWLAEAERLVSEHPGVLLERKRHGFVLHYRAVPQFGEALHAALAALVEAEPRFVLMAARKAWEVRPGGADKGTAVTALMRRPPFLGRLPVFIGDDVTDEDAIRAARAAGGAGMLVPEQFGDAAGVRAWLARTAA
ncbi:MAG: trehalose-phosphatase [Acidisphaera sp.]|nr:trehalose-phosphatase [Acidisphaera sp.]